MFYSLYMLLKKVSISGTNCTTDELMNDLNDLFDMDSVLDSVWWLRMVVELMLLAN